MMDVLRILGAFVWATLCFGCIGYFGQKYMDWCDNFDEPIDIGLLLAGIPIGIMALVVMLFGVLYCVGSLGPMASP